MNPAVFIQARMSSKRLPGKMLKKIDGLSLLNHVCNRVKLSSIPLIVCTSEEASDDSIERECKSIKVDCFRGNLENVALRFIDAAKHFQVDRVIRICGDSPLICPDILKRALSLYDDSVHLVSNIFPRTYPPGQSVEVINIKKFMDQYENFNEKGDFEHVTQYFYRNAAKLSIKNFKNAQDNSNLRMVIDTQEDFEKIVQLSTNNSGLFSMPFDEIRVLFDG